MAPKNLQRHSCELFDSAWARVFFLFRSFALSITAWPSLEANYTAGLEDVEDVEYFNFSLGAAIHF